MHKLKRYIVSALVMAAILLNATVAGAVTYTYDDLGRLVSVNYDNSQQISYTHDPGGNLLKADPVSPSVTSTDYGNVELIRRNDQFTSTTLDPVWTWNVPKVGPTYSLTNNPGWFRLFVPSTGTNNEYRYDHTTTVNNAPKLMEAVYSCTAEFIYECGNKSYA